MQYKESDAPERDEHKERSPRSFDERTSSSNSDITKRQETNQRCNRKCSEAQISKESQRETREFHRERHMQDHDAPERNIRREPLPEAVELLQGNKPLKHWPSEPVRH